MGTSVSSGTASGSTAAGVRFAGVRRVLGMIVGTGVTILFLAAVVAAPLLHVGFSPVLTGSMRPAFVPGDLLITVPVAVGGLEPGQVAVFTPPGESAQYAHRITAVAGDPAHPVLTTKGDANPAPDRWRAKLNEDQVPVVVAVVPYVGNAVLWAQNPVQRAIFIALFGLAVTGVSVRWILDTPSAVSGQTSPSPKVSHLSNTSK
ncbi:signal peptidase I [Arthrobacter sp. ISL-28]|uniref:signal peptidase I n=1 Tax=Arthrobacter sp. ISL-28 TaxID=2819108 RepID=UPI001BECEE38|nr:signal peptidase I [Arthrobacter sp. ISL-28]MBT2519623.1 signal peptidase I [Arthrobacter sp. ISL-28]